MSNNIYDILKKIESLEAPKKTNLTEGKKAKPDYIDIDKDGNKKEPMKKAAKDKAKGGMAEAVARVEKQLSEKFQGFKKSSAPEIGSNLPKSDTETFGLEPGRAYDIKTPKDWKPGDKRRDVRELIPTQDKKDHIRSRLGKHVKPAHLPEGAVEESGLQAYLGKKKYGKEGMSALQKAGRDGASKEKMAQIRAKHDKMDEASYNEEMLSPKQKKIASMAGDPDKIDAKDFAALRGEKKGTKNEGPEILKIKADQAKAQGKDSFEVGDKTFPVKEGRKSMREGWEEMQKYLDKKRGPESKGGEGKKAGTRYGGSAQKDDDDEETDGEGKPVEKKKGRPKGTGGGAKFSFKKPKD
jgi:hypothetical protein